MRHYTTSSAAIGVHRAWVDGLVLLCTILFALFLVYFAVAVLPTSAPASGTAALLSKIKNPLSFFTPPPTTLPVRPVGQAQEVKAVVTQVAEPHISKNAGGREAAGGAQFLELTAVIDNQGKQFLSYSLDDWKVRDAQGHLFAAEGIRGAGWLSGGEVEAGKKVQGTIAFLLPESETHPQIEFSPAALHAVLRWDATPPPVG